jgi:malate dehydrogenase (oxaloacetate-decarboxylating)(NADP+)
MCLVYVQVYPAQANNLYVFPAVGAAALLTRCRTIPHSVFLTAAAVLSNMATPQQLQQGRLFPPLSSIREAEVQLTAALVRFMVQEGLSQLPVGFRGLGDGEGSGVWEELVRRKMFDPLQQQQQQQQREAGMHSNQQLVLSKL